MIVWHFKEYDEVHPAQVFMRSFYGDFLIIKHDLIEIATEQLWNKTILFDYTIRFTQQQIEGDAKQKQRNNWCACARLFCHSWELQGPHANRIQTSKGGNQNVQVFCLNRREKSSIDLCWLVGWLQFDIFVPLQLKESLNWKQQQREIASSRYFATAWRVKGRENWIKSTPSRLDTGWAVCNAWKV